MLVRTSIAVTALAALSGCGQTPQATPESVDSLRAFELLPGHYPGTLSLPQVLNRADEPTLRGLLAQIRTPLQPFLGANLSEEPTDRAGLVRQFTDLLVVDPIRTAGAFEQINQAFQAGAMQELEPEPTGMLPDSVDIEAIGSLPLQRWRATLQEVVPGLLRGYPDSNMPDEQAIRHMAFAEIFWRLSRNALVPDETFRVSYRGRTFTALDPLLDAMVANGYRISAGIDTRVANFTALYAKLPTGQRAPVAAPVFLSTGYQDARGNDALIPVAHTEVVVRMDAPAPTGFSGELTFFMGIGHGARFYGRSTSTEPAWVAPRTAVTFRADEAVRVAKLTGYVYQAISGASRTGKLWNGGYGLLGVCNDSVGVVEAAVRGSTQQYPLFMSKDSILPYVRTRAAQAPAGSAEAEAFALLERTIAGLPVDLQENPSRRERALKSIVYAKGAEPFAVVKEGRRILENAR